ncbi:actin cortical patch SUR7/pH-response regulator pali [Infundibulicybe gibba]|nr:actin cortical patch SUR7/pH-response regulator pali [Infundibulicybe gibba]
MLPEILTPLLIFIAFLLLLLVSLSAPIIKTIYLFRLSLNLASSGLHSGTSATVSFGLWGYCISNAETVIAGIHRAGPSQCSPRHLGYSIDLTAANAVGFRQLETVISRTTTAAFVIHPIAAAFAFVTLLISLFMLRRGSNGTSRLASIVTLSFGLLTTLLTTIVFLIDVILVAVVRGRVRDITDGTIDLNWGNAVWMALGAALALWFSMFGACAGTFVLISSV